MLIPLGTDRPIRRPTIVTPTLIVLCVAAFVYQTFAASRENEDALIDAFAMIGGPAFAWYRPLTYAFLHGDWMHLGGNMLFLWVFGRAVEDRLGRIGFAALYLAGAVASGLGHGWLESSAAIGASGAVSAVTGAFLVLFPRTKIRVLWFMILITALMAPAWFFIGLQIAWNLLAAATKSSGNVAVIAHLAGYAFGFGVAFTLLATGVISKEPCDLFSISRQAKRRRAFRSAAQAVENRTGRSTLAKGDGLDERSEGLARDRAAVSAALSSHNMTQAVEAYRALLDRHAMEHAENRGAVTLARNAQYRLATHLAGEANTETRPLAVRAFDDFLGAFPRDPEADAIRVLLSRLLIETGARPRAVALLREAAGSAKDEGVRSLARAELESLGERMTPGEQAESGS